MSSISIIYTIYNPAAYSVLNWLTPFESVDVFRFQGLVHSCRPCSFMAPDGASKSKVPCWFQMFRSKIRSSAAYVCSGLVLHGWFHYLCSYLFLTHFRHLLSAGSLVLDVDELFCNWYALLSNWKDFLRDILKIWPVFFPFSTSLHLFIASEPSALSHFCWGKGNAISASVNSWGRRPTELLMRKVFSCSLILISSRWKLWWKIQRLGSCVSERP